MSLFHLPARPWPRGVRRTVLALLAGLLVPLLQPVPAPAHVLPPLRARVVEQEIAFGEVRSFPFELSAGEFLGVVVEQNRADVVVELFGPGGGRVLEMDSPCNWLCEEEIALVAESSGSYRLEVRLFPFPGKPPGSFRLRIDGPRAPRGDDAVRIEAMREMRSAHAKGAAERLGHLERAMGLWKVLGERRREAETLHRLMETLASVGRPIEAAVRFHQAVALWQELGLPAQRAWTLVESARPGTGFFQGEEARKYLEESLKLAELAGSPFLEHRALHALGRFHQPRVALPFLERSLKVARAAGDRDLEARSLYQLGYTLDDLAEKQEALRHYEEALRICRELRAAGAPNDTFQANVLNSLGHLYVNLGDQDRAVEHLEQALELSRQSHDAGKEGAALNNLALVYESLDPGRSRELYERAVVLARESGNRNGEVMALNNLAALDLKTDPASTLKRCQEALPLAAGDGLAESFLRQTIGVAHRRLSDLAASRRELETALALVRQRQDGLRQSQVIPELARTERLAGDLPRALAHLEEGVQILESLRTQVVQDELRATFLASRKGTYELYVDTLMALHRVRPGQGYDAEALRASERARARTLLDILAESGADIREGADPALIERERRLLAGIENLERRRLELLDRGAAAPEVRETVDRLEAALEEHGRVEAALRVSSPRYAALTQPQPLSAEEIRSQVLDGRALLLEYALGEERSFLWAVSPGALHSFELPPRSKIEEAARRWYGALRVHPGQGPGQGLGQEPGARAADEARKAADELGSMLLGPVKGLLSGQPLLVVGDGALQYLPFAALPSPASLEGPERIPLIAGHEVVSLPSASALAVLRRELAGRPPAPKTLAVIADPIFQMVDERVARAARRSAEGTGERVGEIDPRKLPRLRFSEKEAEAIAALVPAAQLFKALGFDATRAVATGGELASYRMVHFATHGLIDSRRPELSSLVLSLVNERGEPQNGFLRLHDVYNLELRADLVVLSACQTALGQEVRGEGLVGLTRGFMYAGAARVLASLWSVDDRATSELMKRFYRQMISSRLSPAAALRQAQIEMSRDPRWRSPYYWAGFSLQGEWR
ncbi:MAG TPA: CHAT domain-containing tetratricopeptide repeat protein [Thermoanaerobaculia bacterium]|nr:CHAT domain-containing tetratricopeptide repeat protein [Thermoanaerobaculia bacterium]